MNRRALTAALLFQAGLIVAALVLALLFGLAPWSRVAWSAEGMLVGLAATLPPAVLLIAMPRERWAWADRLRRTVEQLLETLFRGAWPGWVIVVSLLAGLGEELLFRGVLQDGLAAALGPAAALAIASLAFGLAHAVSLAYFLIATGLGIYLGALYLLTDNLLVPMLTHALYDWVAIRYYLRRM